MSVETYEKQIYPSILFKGYPMLPTPWQCQQESTSSGTMGTVCDSRKGHFSNREESGQARPWLSTVA